MSQVHPGRRGFRERNAQENRQDAKSASAHSERANMQNELV